MNKYNIVNLENYRKSKKQTSQRDIRVKSYLDDEERIKTLNLFMKVIATMHKESYK